MTSDDALKILALTREELERLPVDKRSDVVRRAYLRAIRAASPERDPAGFQRVRSAFELLSAGLQTSTPGWGPRPGPRSGATRQAEPPGPRRPQHDEALQAWARRNHSLLIAGEETEVALGRPVTRLLGVAHRLIDSGASEAGVELAELLLARACAEPFGEVGEVRVSLVIDVQLMLLVRGELAAARRVGASSQEWLMLQRALDVLADEGERWIFSCELLSLPDEFSSVLRSELAEALLEQRDGGLARVFAAHPFLTDANTLLLRRWAPLLHELSWREHDQWADRYRYAFLAVGVLMIVIGLLRSISGIA
ncbi:hypothetical protein OV203_29770 [Nannocystis sp. ILAH1]|uniref:hypothetical protein n=1 Tax=unclassified Nannocystis TaxID=2627009 RepID=UPI00226FBD32|nr:MULTISPECIES: hypothetical protein [unclassified Nannocystis]MCY0991373.1 hypothetical protein [Nannocystis sp. ILAH1]MCY1066422.1 hypothetical protein [Nannocystis sp. RBIL2]